MNKLKKAAAVAVMVGGLGLAGSGVASATGGHDYDDPFPFPFAINNLQVVDCEQSFDGGTAFAPVTGAVTGDNSQNIGNFCTVIGSVGD
ncbi:Secreted protein OS=Streptomyces aurantiogriseus OX=66870 GN=GCM10010251_70840 PE=4 SV=1 [Streptomyces aurantiogriseus]